MGSTPPPFTESPLSFSEKHILKGIKMMFYYYIKLKMDKKRPYDRTKGLKLYEKGQKIEFSDLKNLLFSGIFLSGIGG